MTGGENVIWRQISVAIAILIAATLYFADSRVANDFGLGISSAYAQRTAPARSSNAATTSQRVADAYNEALELIQAGQHQAGIDRVRDVLNGASAFEQSIIYRLMGQAEIDRDNFLAAAGHFQSAINSGGLEGDDQAQLYLILGQIYTAAERYADAIRTLEQYFEVAEEPQPQAYFALAQVYAVAERYQEAIPYAQEAVSRSEDFREPFYRLLMYLYLTTEDWPPALPLLQRLVAEVPTKDNYWSSLGGVYAQLGRERDAFSVYQFRYLMGFLETSRELVALADLYSYYDYPYKAAGVLDRELEAQRIERTGANWEKLGNAWFSAREFEDSRAALTRAANLSPDGQIYYRIAGTYIQEENWSQARRFLLRALNRGGLDDTGQAWLLLGHAHNALDDLDGAREAFGRAAGYASFREDAESWIEYIDAREVAAAAEAAQQEAYQAEASEIMERGEVAAQMAEAAFGLAQEAYEQARLARRVSASERASIIATAEATLEEARLADDAARNPEFGTEASVRERVRSIGSDAREDGNSALAVTLEETSERFIERRITALTESDRLIRDAEDQLFQARQM